MSDKTLPTTSHETPPRRLVATQAIDRLLAILPAPAFGNPDAVTAALVAIVERYPEPVIAALADPARGIAAGAKFFPLLSEVREWCERETVRLTRADREQALRRALPPPVDRSNRPTLEELKAKYGPGWGIKRFP